MISRTKYYNECRAQFNTERLISDRQYGAIDRIVQRRLHAASPYIDRLEQEAVLHGHDGCVNCLEWSSDGRVLASGSDDFQVMLWDPFRSRKLHSIRTRHIGNMFSVKFIPRRNDSLIATGAADKCVYVFDVNRQNETVMSCQCHTGRVKRLATAPDSPYVFWSAGEDGCIFQFDLREHHRCTVEAQRVCLIKLTTYLDPNAEAKCLAVNPRRTELLAVGANDPYARVYDRRMLQHFLLDDHPRSISDIGQSDSPVSYNVPKDCVTYYCPGHINKNNSKLNEHESRAITYLTFNATGTELLVNMGGEHVYLYDLLNAEQPVFLSLPEYEATATTDVEMVTVTEVEERSERAAAVDEGVVDLSEQTASNSSVKAPKAGTIPRKLPEHIETLKKLGNDFLENEKYLRAIDQYSDAIAMAPDCSVLYLNRATAYMRRLWFGDVYAALRDCHQALRLEPGYIKAHFRLARSLLELGRPQEAEECLKELINRFPSYANNHGVTMLHKDIKDNRQSSQTNQQATEGYNYSELSNDEYEWRSKAKDYDLRFVGHCNTTTDIKEANYFGYDGDFIVAGSDDGNFFIWDRKTCKIRAIYKGDGAIVNCVQPHPDICLMATSGIDHDIKIWSPMVPDKESRPNIITNTNKCVEDNQQKMKTDPFDLNTRNTFCWSG